VRNALRLAAEQGAYSIAMSLNSAGTGGGNGATVQGFIEEELRDAACSRRVAVVRYVRGHANEVQRGRSLPASRTAAAAAGLSESGSMLPPPNACSYHGASKDENAIPISLVGLR